MNRKGVTPVVATVLLIGISVGASFTAWTFVLSANNQAQQNYEDRAERDRLEDQTALDIERVVNSSNGYAFLYIRNIGSRSIVLRENGQRYLSMFVDGRPVGKTPQEWDYISSSQDELNSGSLITLNSTEEFPSTGEKEFKVSARYGASSVHRCAASEGSPC